MARKIGVLGGTFDPIHYGHLALAEAARHQLGLERVLFMPTARPPHKQREVLDDGPCRARMVELAIRGNPGFALSCLELERGGFSYTVDTVLALREIYGAGADIWFVTGADMILSVQTWMRAEELKSLCRFAAAPRPGFDLAGLAGLPPDWQERIQVLDAPELALSSTDLRRRLALGLPIRYLLPDIVEKYILRQGLYV